MKLLFDENISHKLVPALVDLYPGSTHPRDIGLKTSDDRLIWEYAKNNGFMIISKDADFSQSTKPAIQASTKSNMDSARQLCYENGRVNLEK